MAQVQNSTGIQHSIEPSIFDVGKVSKNAPPFLKDDTQEVSLQFEHGVYTLNQRRVLCLFLRAVGISSMYVCMYVGTYVHLYTMLPLKFPRNHLSMSLIFLEYNMFPKSNGGKSMLLCICINEQSKYFLLIYLLVSIYSSGSIKLK